LGGQSQGQSLRTANWISIKISRLLRVFYGRYGYFARFTDTFGDSLRVSFFGFAAIADRTYPHCLAYITVLTIVNLDGTSALSLHNSSPDSRDEDRQTPLLWVAE